MSKTKVTTYTQPLLDAFGRELNIGDIVLGARGRPNNYVETVYMHSIVIGRTKAMLRLHQVDSYNLNKIIIEASIEQRYGRGGGKINPAETILVLQGFLSEQEMEDALDKGKAALVLPAAPLFSTSSLTPSPSNSSNPFNTLDY